MNLHIVPHLFLWFTTASLAHPLADNTTSTASQPGDHTTSAASHFPLNRFLHDEWPSVPGSDFTLSSRSIMYRTRLLSHTHFLALVRLVFADVESHINDHGNSPIPTQQDPPLRFESRGIKFEISGFAAVGRRIPEAGEGNDVRLRWGDIIPIIAVFRAKMSRDEEWRESAVWIWHPQAGVRVGMASLERASPND
ncbi:MAG: hypothetical protein Q9210_006573 [Variospora velana]